jgi:hypothetical protein
MDQAKFKKSSKKIVRSLLGCFTLTILLFCFYLANANADQGAGDGSGADQIPAGHLEKCIISSDLTNEIEGSHRLKIKGENYFWCSAFRIIDIEEVSGPSSSQPDYTYRITEANTTVTGSKGNVFLIHSDIKQSLNPSDWN